MSSLLSNAILKLGWHGNGRHHREETMIGTERFCRALARSEIRERTLCATRKNPYRAARSVPNNNSYGRANNDSFRRRAVFWLAVEQSGCKRVPTTAGFNSFPGNSETSKHKGIGPQIENLPAFQSEPRGGTRVEGSTLSIAHKIVRVPDLAQMKARGERIVMLTAYDATMTRLFDRAGIDLLLVGDSLGNVILGLDTTIQVTLDEIIHHTRAVTRAASRALVVADMPFLTYQISAEQATRNAARLFPEGGAAAVKLEGGRAVADTVRRLTAAGLLVMGHVGLTPQHVHRLGGLRRQARNEEAAQELILDA